MIIITIVIIILGILAWLYFSNPKAVVEEEGNTFFFACPSGTEIKISYDKESDSASLYVEGKEYKVYPTISASGARYSNDDQTVVFWEHQGEAMVEIDGEVIYKECKLKK